MDFRSRKVTLLLALVLELVSQRSWIAHCLPMNAFPLPQVTQERAQETFPDYKTLLDLPLPQLLKAIPELQGLEYAEGQDKLYGILGQAGETVQEVIQNLSSTVANEKVTQEQLGPNGNVVAEFHPEFSYLMLVHHDGDNSSLEEKRTSSQGKLSEPGGGGKRFPMTHGFAFKWTLLYPSNRAGSKFRYLGQQLLDGRKTYVVAYAQRPGWANQGGTANMGGKSVPILFQGVTWIDSVDYQVVRMREFLLVPRLDIELETQTTEIQYGEVHVPDAASALWLPHQVIVTEDYSGMTFRNRHVYSDYKLYTGDTPKP